MIEPQNSIITRDFSISTGWSIDNGHQKGDCTPQVSSGFIQNSYSPMSSIDWYQMYTFYNQTNLPHKQPFFNEITEKNLSAQAVSSPSGVTREDKVTEWSGAIFMMKFWSVTKKCDRSMETRTEPRRSMTM